MPKAESERENGHLTSDCYFFFFICSCFFSWVQAAVGGIAKVFLASANTLSGLVRIESGGYSVLQRSSTAAANVLQFAAPLRI